MSKGRTTDQGYAETVERNLPAIAELCRRFGVRRLDLFGSAAIGRFDPEGQRPRFSRRVRARSPRKILFPPARRA
jgi:hypothetical protein